MPDQTPPNAPDHSSASTSSLDLTSDAVRERVVRLAFGGDQARYDEFLRVLRETIPPDVAIVLRGSAVTGTRWEDGAPFDADGPGTSDLDLTLVGGGMVNHFEVFYIPGLHTAPLSEEHPDASATFVPLRQALCRIAGRPVNIQATADLVQFARDLVMSQPYFVMIPKADAKPDNDR
jgi:hypothetical protein